MEYTMTGNFREFESCVRTLVREIEYSAEGKDLELNHDWFIRTLCSAGVSRDDAEDCWEHKVNEAFASLHAEVLPVHPIQMPQRHKDGLMFDHWEIAWWKLQIWNLTQFEKLIWLDSDAILTRSIDWLFDRPWMWSQRDDWFCDLNVPKVCSGIVLIYPDEKDFEGLLKYAAEVEDLSDGGDQKLISLYFKNVRHKPVNLLDDLEASFGHCLGKAQSP
ncbi:unnamed protein product, partial [Prorocentrum cordatum]